MGPDLRRATALLPLGVVVVVLVVLLITNRQAVPSLRGPIARVAPVGPIDSDLVHSQSGAPSARPRSPGGQACLDRVSRGPG